jgi:hypothetical protein
MAIATYAYFSIKPRSDVTSVNTGSARSFTVGLQS